MSGKSEFEWYHALAIATGMLALLYTHYDETFNVRFFNGNDLWDSDSLGQCMAPVNAPSELSCYTYRVEFEIVKVELLSVDPILMIYHQFASETEVTEFLADADTKHMTSLKVYSEEEDDTMSGLRQANGTCFEHEESEGVERVFRKLERSLPALDLHMGETWQIVSYMPGGHYVPHHDYYEYDSEEQWDDVMRDSGNRFATLLLILKTADKGGETVYPYLQRTIIPKAGDVLLWTNLDRKGEGSVNSLHGACPVVEGEKIAATLWIRERGQPMMDNPTGTELFDIEKLTRPEIIRI